MLFTRALKPDLLDPELSGSQSGFSLVSRVGLDLMHCPSRLSRSAACISDLDRGLVEAKWSLDSDLKSHVESRHMKYPLTSDHLPFGRHYQADADVSDLNGIYA